MHRNLLPGHRRVLSRARLVFVHLLVAAILLGSNALVGAPAAAQAVHDPVYPSAEWEYVGRRALEAYGWSASGLRRAWEFIRDSSNTTGLIVVDRGRVVFQFGDVEELSLPGFGA